MKSSASELGLTNRFSNNTDDVIGDKEELTGKQMTTENLRTKPKN